MAMRELAEDVKARWQRELANRFPAPSLDGADVTAEERILAVEHAVWSMRDASTSGFGWDDA